MVVLSDLKRAAWEELLACMGPVQTPGLPATFELFTVPEPATAALVLPLCPWLPGLQG